MPDNFVQVSSSMLDSVSYDPGSRVLKAKFKNGAIYHHHDVGVDKHEALMGAASPGQFYNSKIRDHHPGKKAKD